MSEYDEKNPAESGHLDISEYIPGSDLTKDRKIKPGAGEAKRLAVRRRSALRRKLFRVIPAVVLALLIFLAVVDVHMNAPFVVQYVFLYFIFEAVFAEKLTTLGLSFGMLILFGLFMTGFLDLLLFMFLTFIALLIFLYLEKNIWLRAMNILVLGTWALMMILLAFSLWR